MEQPPKILLVEHDQDQADALGYVSEGIFDLEVADTVASAIGRVGVQQYRLVVLDSQIDSDEITRRLVQFFRTMNVPVMIFGEKMAGANGYPVLAKGDRGKFVQKVSGLLGKVSTLV